MDLSTSQLFQFFCLVLLLPWVRGAVTDGEGCIFGNSTDYFDENYFELFPGKPQGRVRVLCGNEWGTISCRGAGNAAIVASLVCRKLGYGGGIPIESSDEFGGFGPEWNVSCSEQHQYIENCTFTRVEEKSYDDIVTPSPYWEHDKDLYVKCGARTSIDVVTLRGPENITMFVLTDVATFAVLLALIIIAGIVVYHLLIRKFKSVDKT